ncbi:fucose permease [Cryptosporangium arvum DSM 44712]|uniref:Fucose permease n=1 Tax=Cryptosporangium arvum DSM 44712 TaxID=927661 RepID=A0A010Z2Y7_9ACTN|nr:fucose permease [Cryptosporangium arvum DSM 44712]
MPERDRTPSPRRHYAAVATLFALDGAIFGTWAARVPDVADRVGATHTALGTALFGVSLGALVSMRLTGAWCARFGAGRVAAVAGVLVALALIPPGFCTGLGALCVALTAFGAATGAANVAANSLGVSLGQHRRRPVMSALHALFSFGGLAGALLGGLASAMLPVPVHFTAVATVGALLATALRPALRSPDSNPTPDVTPAAAPEGTPRAAPAGTGPAPVGAGPGGSGGRGVLVLLVLLGAIAGSTAFAEGALSDWGALHLRETLHATPGVAAAGYAAFCLAMGCGRLAGARWVIRFGDTRVLVAGALAAAIGATAAAYGTDQFVALGGFVLVGLGLANVFPLVIGRAGLVGGPRGVGLASTVGYSGLLGGPPVVGFLAAHAGLPAALSTITALALVAAALAVVVAVELPDATTVAAALRSRARVYAALTADRLGASVGDLSLLLDASDHAVTTDHTRSRPATAPPPAGTIRGYPGLEFLVP